MTPSLGSSEPSGTAPRWWLLGVVLVTYAAVVVVGSAYHEPWRDEVVALSIAREMPSFLDLWRFMRHEEHPILLYLCLRVASRVVGAAALPAVSLLAATAAAFVWLRYCPLPFWLRGLFLFGYFPLYEYAVVWRGYGLGMLLLFGFCALFPRRRERPIAVGLVLALLANATLFAMVISLAAAAMLVVDRLLDARPVASRRDAVVGIAIYVAGVAHTIVSILPDPDVFPLELYHHDAATVLRGVLGAIAFPAGHVGGLFFVPYPSLWMWAWFAWLLASGRVALAAFPALSLFGLETIFTLGYPPSPRHVGHVVVVVMATLWLGSPWAIEPERAARPSGRAIVWGGRLLAIPLLVALAYQVFLGGASIVDEVRFEHSSSRRLASLIAGDPSLERAIVVGEPETLALALPYYRANPVYLFQEGAFRNWLMIQTPHRRRNDCDLGELLDAAKALRARHGVPVIVALGWRLDGPERQMAFARSFFEQTFTMTPAARDAFLAQTEFRGRMRNAVFTDENYDVFVLR